MSPKAPRGGAAPGPRPVARAKAGTKGRGRSAGRGAPLAGVGAGAKAPDTTLGRETGDRPAGERPETGVSRWPPLSRAAGYTYDAVSAGSLERDSLLQLRPPARAELAGAPQKQYPARRGVGERTQAWQNKCRRLVVRWEQKLDQYYALIALASGLIIWRLIATAGP